MKTFIIQVIGFKTLLALTAVFFIIFCICIAEYVKGSKANDIIVKKKAIYGAIYSFITFLVFLIITLLI